ncbi:class F sortase [Streptomyces sp. NPDC093085]|uniref:class F sortase n=1 Tax=Streptomyces sp. NPDC093085 TaxID=3155068 RepID=UPI00342751E7
MFRVHRPPEPPPEWWYQGWSWSRRRRYERGSGRLITGTAWAILLLGLWIWAKDQPPVPLTAPATGDIAAVGRPGTDLPPPRTPLDSGLPGHPDPYGSDPYGQSGEPGVPDGGTPRRVEIPSLGIEAPVVARGLDATGAVDPPPYGTPDTVGWYGGGVRPGAAGAAILVGHVDTRTEPAVFYGLSSAKRGGKVRVARTDGQTAEFTIEDVQVVERDRFDPLKVYGSGQKTRAELRLITCGGTFDKAAQAYSANVVVSAYLTAVR